MLFLCVGYAAFSTNLNITAKGNIKDINIEVDEKVPKQQLIFWGQANNKENTLTTFKDKSGNNNGILYNFNNSSQSGFNNNELILDGVDDYVDIGLGNYDFKNSISYVIYVKINELNRHQIILGNWGVSEVVGSGLYINDQNILKFDICDGTLYNGNASNTPMTSDYYTFVATYDGKESKLFINGTLENTKEVSNGISTSSSNVLIGSYIVDGVRKSFANISVKEAMIYDRALTQEEVKLITEGFQKKYKNS